MIILKVIAILLAALATLGGVIGGSYFLVQDNPLDSSHQHELALVEAKDATCDENGVRQHYACKGCDKVFADKNGYVVLETKDVTIEANGHYWKDATCSDAKICEVCKKTEGDPLGHTPKAAVKENITPASCTAEGSCESVVYCADCNTELSRKAEVLGKTPHIPAAAVKENNVDPTCYAEGSYDSVTNCSQCGTHISTVKTTVDKISHTHADAVKENEKPATCLEAGSYDSVVYCSVEACKAKISSTTVVTKALGHIDNDGNAYCDRDGCGLSLCADGHTEVVDPAVAPTCTTTGLTEGKHCSVCNTVTVPQEVVPIAHKLAYHVRGTLAVNKDGSYNTDNLVVSMLCTECGEYEEAIPRYAAATDETEEVAGYVIKAENPLANGGSITYGENVFTFPALNLTNYNASSTYSGGDKAPTVVTTFALKDSDFACSVISGDAINLITDGSKVVYSRYELEKLNNDDRTITYDENAGYLYASKKSHTVPYLAAYGTTLTITGTVYIKTEYRVNVNNALIIGTDDTPANVTIERTKTVSGNNHVIGLYGGGDLTIKKNSTLKTIGIATDNKAYDLFIGADGTIVLIEEKASFTTGGLGENYCIYSAGNNSRIIVDGTISSNRSIYMSNVYEIGDQYEYGFQPALYIRKGTVSLDCTTAIRVSALQVGSEKENASGHLSVKATGDTVYMGSETVRMTFAKGSLTLESTGSSKAGFNTAGTFNAKDAIFDFKSGCNIKGINLGHFIGIWKSSNSDFVQSWMFEEGVNFDFTGVSNLATPSTVSPVKVIAYKEVQMSIDGVVKTVLVASTLAGSVKTPSNLVFPTVDTTATWTTDASVAVVNGFSAATDGTNIIYYK